MDWERYVVFVEVVRQLKSEAARFLDRDKAMGAISPKQKMELRFKYLQIIHTAEGVQGFHGFCKI